MGLPPETDYYEILQISPNADPETVHRVYRIMASRFHPDNPTTGSLERFIQLREAYQTLSDPALRAAYDAGHQIRQTQPLPIFWQKSFVDGVEGEANRRLGVLSLLYHRRRVNENRPGVSVMELERRMAFPREYLNFALWYLRAKGYVQLMEDNSDYAVTGAGVDYLESCSVKNKVIRELLTAGTGAEDTPPTEPARNLRRMSPRLNREAEPDAGLITRTGSAGAD
jgi:curved DNA-binding protein CbpA